MSTTNIKVKNRLKKIEDAYFKDDRNAAWYLKIFEQELEKMYDLGHADGYAEGYKDGELECYTTMRR